MRKHAAAPSGTGLCCLVALALALPGAMRAQNAPLRGTVADSAGAPIVGADVGIASLHKLTRTDDHGRFAFEKLPLGPVELSVRRLGYEPQKVPATVSNTLEFSYTVTLSAQPAMLGAMDVSEKKRHQAIEGFHQRRVVGIGAYVTRDDILARHANAPSEMLRSMSGLQVVRTRTGFGVRFASASSGRRDCPPTMWIDGQRAAGMEVDEIPIDDIEGIELYRGASTTPAQFSRGAGPSCGTVVIWTRTPGGS
jgi:Carboxypeptidase regulatory-like domain/TonB-dependent Receptor Plug Domain